MSKETLNLIKSEVISVYTTYSRDICISLHDKLSLWMKQGGGFSEGKDLIYQHNAKLFDLDTRHDALTNGKEKGYLVAGKEMFKK